LRDRSRSGISITCPKFIIIYCQGRS
jgi:hypothetical protein